MDDQYQDDWCSMFHIIIAFGEPITTMQSYWFGDVDENGCNMVPGGLDVLVSRFGHLHIIPDQFVPFDWSLAKSCGCMMDREEYIGRLRQLCFYLAEQGITHAYEGRDAELLQMIRTLDELDEVSNLITERALEWHRVKNPAFSRKYQRLPRQKLLGMMKRGEGSAIPSGNRGNREYFCNKGDPDERGVPSGRRGPPQLQCTPWRTCCSKAGLPCREPCRTFTYAGQFNPGAWCPDCPFFTYEGGTPPPKHGIIFQHRRVHNAPKDVRGRVARVLAAKLAIAARLDYYRQELVPEFIEGAQKSVDNAGENHDMA